MHRAKCTWLESADFRSAEVQNYKAIVGMTTIRANLHCGRTAGEGRTSACKMCSFAHFSAVFVQLHILPMEGQTARMQPRFTCRQ
jgi:hypothetical protein